MEQNPQTVSNEVFGMTHSGYDPLVDFEVDEEDLDESDGQLGPRTDYQAQTFYVVRPDGRSASERIEDLFDSLASRRRVLLGILQFLDAPKRSDALDEKVAELQRHDVSVYSGYNYSSLLNEAGAIAKVNEDGSDFDEDFEQLPDIVEVDGVRFYKPTNGKQVFWRITSEGCSYLEAEDPFGHLAELIQEEAEYQTIYKSLLEACNSNAGKSATELAGLIDNDPLVQKPRRYFSYFVKKLEDCGALVWADAWQTTAVGSRALEQLFSGNGQVNQ